MNNKLRTLLKLFLPPIAVKLVRLEIFKKHPYVYAPDGWKTPLKQDHDIGWNSTSAVEIEKKRWPDFCKALQGTGPIGFMHEHDDPTEIKEGYHHRNITFAYVLALAAVGKKSISILDYGGSLGHNYNLAKVLLPEDIKIDFHCKEVPLLVETGRQLNPDITWYSDDRCLNNKYDLVIANGVLQCVENWQELLLKLVGSVGDYLFLGHLPIVNKSDGFVMHQKRYNTEMLHHQFNRNELLSKIAHPLVREFLTGVHPYIKNAPEQCELRSFLFRAGTKIDRSK